MEEKIGYVALEFGEDFKQEIMKWSSQIGESDLVTAIIDGKAEGGNVTDKLHLTLFYGLDENTLDQDKLSKFITTLPKLMIRVTGIGTFPQDVFACKAIYLEVSDDSGELQTIHEWLKKFPHFSKYQKYDYKPHITIAYVTTGFDINLLTNDFPKNLSVKAITHFS